MQGDIRGGADEGWLSGGGDSEVKGGRLTVVPHGQENVGRAPGVGRGVRSGGKQQVGLLQLCVQAGRSTAKLEGLVAKLVVSHGPVAASAAFPAMVATGVQDSIAQWAPIFQATKHAKPVLYFGKEFRRRNSQSQGFGRHD